jgi:hypothetical protein
MNLTVIIAAVSIALGGLVALGNWWNVFLSYHTKRFHSPVPLIGAGLLGSGMYVLPATRPYCWAALILDVGTLALLFAVPQIVRDACGTSRFNLVSEYVAQTSTRAVYLRLFRRGIFTVRQQLHRGLIISRVGEWRREGDRLTFCLGDESAVFDVVRDIPTEMLRQAVGFPSWEKHQEFSLADIKFSRGRR